jgi:hypothetical protein
MLIGVEISGDITVFQKEAEKIKDLTVEIQRIWNARHLRYANNNRGKWNHFKIIEKIPGQHNGKARNEASTKATKLDTEHLFREVLT